MGVQGVAQRPVSQAPQSAGGAGSVSQHTLVQKGSRGPEVAQLQQQLSQAGFPAGQSGVFDAKTEQAVKQYQQSKGLQVDGQVGQQTWGSFLGQKLPPGTEMLRGGGGGAAGGADPTGRFKDTFEPSGGQRPGAPAGAPAGGAQGPGAANFPAGGSNRDKLNYASNLAKQFGLTITSTTGGKHAPGSYHYSGRAIDVAGSPQNMARFYDALKGSSPTELFYDPKGGIKHGNQIGAIGGHSDHVHVAY